MMETLEIEQLIKEYLRLFYYAKEMGLHDLQAQYNREIKRLLCKMTPALNHKSNGRA